MPTDDMTPQAIARDYERQRDLVSDQCELIGTLNNRIEGMTQTEAKLRNQVDQYRTVLTKLFEETPTEKLPAGEGWYLTRINGRVHVGMFPQGHEAVRPVSKAKP